MAQTYKYQIVGDTQQAVKGNEALDTSIKQVDNSTQKLTTDLKKTDVSANQAFSQQLEAKIKSTDAVIKGLGGTMSLLTGTLSTVVGTLGLFGLSDEQTESFQKAALSVLALGSGIQQQLTGLKDVTEAQKLQNEVTQASTIAENTNTAALTTNKDAVKGVTAAFQQSTLSIATENAEVGINTGLRGANTVADAANTTAKGANTIATYLNVAAQKALNLAIKANPYLALISILASVTTLIYGVVTALFSNTKAEENNTRAKELNEQAIKAQEDATKSLDRARRESSVEAAKRAVREAAAEKAGAEARLARARLENRFSEEAEQARIDAINARTALTNAELDLQEVQEEARKKAANDAKIQADKNKQLRNERLEREGIIQLIQLEIDEFKDSILFAPAREGSLLDVRNLKSVEESLNGIKTILVEIDTEDLDITFLSQEQLDILKRLRGELDTELQQQLFDREQQYKDELALFADNEDAKSRLTEEYEQDRAKIRRQYAIQNAQEIIGITSNFLTVIADINQASLELQLQQAAGNQAAIDRINKDALERQKKLRIAQTLVTTAESILNAFNSTSTLPPPFNLIAGGALAAVYTALGAKTIQTISATTLEGGGGGGFNNIPGGGAAFGSINLGGAAAPTAPFPTGILPGVGGGRLGVAGVGEAQIPIRAYVLAGDVESGVQANIALNNRRRLAG